MFTNGLLEDGVQGVINLDGEGIFVVHSIGISVLETGSQSWVAGPVFAAPAVCGCNISGSSFVTIHMNATNNVRQYSVSNNIITPEEIDLWPDLRTPRWGPACGATLSHLVIAGGVSNWDEVLASVEVFDISRKSIRRGGSLKRPRAYFQIIPVGFKHPRLLAIGSMPNTSHTAIPCYLSALFVGPRRRTKSTYTHGATWSTNIGQSHAYGISPF